MRTLRLSLVGTVILMLLAGLGGAVVAQDEEVAVKATHVTGTTTANRVVHPPTFTTADDFSHNTGRGGVFERDIEWSDPRLPSVLRLSENWDFYSVGESDGVNGAMSFVHNVRLDGPDGAWTGTAYALVEEMTDETYPATMLMVLSGEGEYEGLSAMFRKVEGEAGPLDEWDGYILEGPMTPTPEAPEPAAE